MTTPIPQWIEAVTAILKIPFGFACILFECSLSYLLASCSLKEWHLHAYSGSSNDRQLSLITHSLGIVSFTPAKQFAGTDFIWDQREERKNRKKKKKRPLHISTSFDPAKELRVPGRVVLLLRIARAVCRLHYQPWIWIKFTTLGRCEGYACQRLPTAEFLRHCDDSHSGHILGIC